MAISLAHNLEFLFTTWHSHSKHQTQKPALTTPTRTHNPNSHPQPHAHSKPPSYVFRARHLARHINNALAVCMPAATRRHENTHPTEMRALAHSLALDHEDECEWISYSSPPPPSPPPPFPFPLNSNLKAKGFDGENGVGGEREEGGRGRGREGEGK